MARKKSSHTFWRRYRLGLMGIGIVVIALGYSLNRLATSTNQVYEINAPSMAERIYDDQTCVPRPLCTDGTNTCMPKLDGSINWCPLASPGSTVSPYVSPLPSGCHYLRVMCVKAPCNPVISCTPDGSTDPNPIISSPVPAMTIRPIPSASPLCKLYYRPCTERICEVGEVCPSPDCKPVEICSSPTPFPKPTPRSSCVPRPACLDTNPRCLLPETENMCPRTSTRPSPSPLYSPKPSCIPHTICTTYGGCRPDNGCGIKPSPSPILTPKPTPKQVCFTWRAKQYCWPSSTK